MNWIIELTRNKCLYLCIDIYRIMSIISTQFQGYYFDIKVMSTLARMMVMTMLLIFKVLRNYDAMKCYFWLLMMIKISATWLVFSFLLMSFSENMVLIHYYDMLLCSLFMGNYPYLHKVFSLYDCFSKQHFVEWLKTRNPEFNGLIIQQEKECQNIFIDMHWWNETKKL